MPISISVNVDKVDQKRFYKGEKGRYLDLVLFETPESDYGDYMVKQRAKKGEKMPILGNAKFFKLRKKEDREDDEREPKSRGSSDNDQAW